MNKKQLTVKKLDINNLADVMKLQEKIISGLPTNSTLSSTERQKTI